ncbi:PREDICTED: proline-rich receptor-like protein kinase PERK9, partial [Vollenhovia emeryi]|uniref:proline-rich receptor-like protein kinase PERK9 n=1 Tax=Vollenhovia emeryi TaxID=411798 RepID=UPI0005F48DF3
DNPTPSSPPRKKRRHNTRPSSSSEETLLKRKSRPRVVSVITIPPAEQVIIRPNKDSKRPPQPEEPLIQEDLIDPTTPPRAITPDYQPAEVPPLIQDEPPVSPTPAAIPPAGTAHHETAVTWELERLSLQPPRFSRPRHPPLEPRDPRSSRPISPRHSVTTADKWTQTSTYATARREKQRVKKRQRAPLTETKQLL